MYVEFDFVNFVNALTTMSNRIEKRCNRPQHLKIISYDIILEPILQNPTKITPYHYYKNKKFLYLSCPFYSDRCFKCIYDNQSYCDVRGLSIFQLRKIATQHSKAES